MAEYGHDEFITDMRTLCHSIYNVDKHLPSIRISAYVGKLEEKAWMYDDLGN